MILLSKAMDVGRDHLIHRKRSPFPYEGKDLMLRKVGETSNARRNRAARQRFARRDWEVSRPTFAVSPKFRQRIVLPLEGKGDRSAVDEVTCGPAPLREALPRCRTL